MKENHVDLIALGPGNSHEMVSRIQSFPDERPCMLLMGMENDAFLCLPLMQRMQ
jgi:hypothetical protein